VTDRVGMRTQHDMRLVGVAAVGAGEGAWSASWASGTSLASRTSNAREFSELACSSGDNLLGADVAQHEENHTFGTVVLLHPT
jgi:hypothetical protein